MSSEANIGNIGVEMVQCTKVQEKNNIDTKEKELIGRRQQSMRLQRAVSRTLLAVCGSARKDGLLLLVW